MWSDLLITKPKHKVEYIWRGKKGPRKIGLSLRAFLDTHSVTCSCLSVSCGMCEGIFSFCIAHSRSEPLLDTSGLHCQFIWCDGCFTREHENRYLTVLHSIFVACLDPRSMRCSLLCFGCSADLIFSILSRSCNIASSRGRVINRLSLSPGVIILYGLKAL